MQDISQAMQDVQDKAANDVQKEGVVEGAQKNDKKGEKDTDKKEKEALRAEKRAAKEALRAEKRAAKDALRAEKETSKEALRAEKMAVKGARRAEKAAANSVKVAARLARRAHKALEGARRQLVKQLGDGIKEGLRLSGPDSSAEAGTLKQNCSLASFRAVFSGGPGGFGAAPRLSPPDYNESTPEVTASLTKQELVSIFGTSKIEGGGSKDRRYDCDKAKLSFIPATGELTLSYTPKFMGAVKKERS